MTTSTSLITNSQKEQYRNEGYFILDNVIPADDLAILREQCAIAMSEMDAKMDREGTDVLGLTHKDKRYFIINRSKQSPGLRDILQRDYMAQICRATIGQEAYLFYEQYVVKAAEKGIKFNWHQDSGYLEMPHKPYVTCWFALDDMSMANGTVSVLPYSRAGTKEIIPHFIDEKTNDKVGYNGDDLGIPVIVPAGGMAVFSSTTLHSSGQNTTDKMRRTFVAQYSPEAIIKEDGTPWSIAKPFLKNGVIVRE